MQQDVIANHTIDRERLFAERVRILHENLLIALIGNFVCTVIIFYVLFRVVNLTYILSWLIVSTLILIIRGLFLLSYQKHPEYYRRYFHLYVTGSALSAMLWGIAGSLFMTLSGVLQQLVIIVIVAGVTSGALQTLEASGIAGSTYVLFAIGPLAFWLLQKEDKNYLLIGLAMTTYLLFMLAVARRGYNIITEGLRLRFENVGLVTRLERSNEELQNEVKKRRKAQTQLEYLASHDVLTKLPNRAVLESEFNAMVQAAENNQKKFAVIFLDIDHFKEINDRLGHAIGDEVLTMVAKRLQSCIRKSDVVIRMGGDEFVMFLTNIDSDSMLRTLVKKIRSAFQDFFHLNGEKIPITVSMGICIYPDQGTDQDTLLKKADAALYIAKEQGKNCYEFYSES